MVADEKTPLDWAMDGVVVLSVAEQEKLPYSIAKLAPGNSYTYGLPPSMPPERARAC
jgi:hypothetical protein